MRCEDTKGERQRKRSTKSDILGGREADARREATGRLLPKGGNGAGRLPIG